MEDEIRNLDREYDNVLPDQEALTDEHEAIME
jgi:hypothetical protein